MTRALSAGRLQCQYENACLYCDGVLSSNHEHDHMPIPARHGGEETHCVCANCHDLKDRQTVKDWPVAAFGQVMQSWTVLPPIGRIFLAKCMALALDQERRDPAG